MRQSLSKLSPLPLLLLFLSSGANVESFAISSPITRPVELPRPTSAGVSLSSAGRSCQSFSFFPSQPSPQNKWRSPLFSSLDHQHRQSRKLLSPVLLCRRFLGRAMRLSLVWSQVVRQSLRRSLMTLSLAAVLWGGFAVTATPPSLAATSSTSTTTASTIIESLLERSSPSLDQIVDRYVKKHMFDDDRYDPVDSIYREAYEDATAGQYPAALAEVTSQVLGEKTPSVGAGKRSTSLLSSNSEEGFGNWLASTIQKIQQRTGLSESAAIFVLAGVFVIAGPSVFLFVGMIIGGISKRNIRSVMKKRYGDTYTVDATIKTEPEVEAPDDDEDEDDDEETSKDDKDDDDEDEDDDD